MKDKTLKPLAITFLLSGIWDTVSGFMYFLQLVPDVKLKLRQKTLFSPYFLVPFLSVLLTCSYYLLSTSHDTHLMLAASSLEDDFILSNFIATWALLRTFLLRFGLLV
jgi:hypothetical protein